MQADISKPAVFRDILNPGDHFKAPFVILKATRNVVEKGRKWRGQSSKIPERGRAASRRPYRRSGGFRPRHLAPDFRRRFVFAQTFKDELAQQIVLRQVRNFTSATSSGRTQCTRLSTKGDPKRLPRGGGTSSGIVSVASGCSFRHSRSSSAVLVPVPARPA
jgi:hypothetical protein